MLPGLVPFAIGLGVIAVHTVFYLTLVVMLGTFLSSRGAVVGIALGLLFGQQLAGNLLGQSSREQRQSCADQPATPVIIGSSSKHV